MSDIGDRYISFDNNGYCNYCNDALSKINTTVYFPTEEGSERLEEMIAKVKKENKNKPYDCVMGISGGLDSAYLAYLGYTWGLRILAVHIDDGFDTETSKNNIRKLCTAAKIDLRTIVPDPVQYYALTKAYMKAGVPNIAVPQDNILFAFLYDTVEKEKLKYFLAGGNFSLECILQKDYVFNPMDTVNIRDINRRFGTDGLNNLKFINSYRKYINLKLGRVVTLYPLNLIDYNKDRAIWELESFCGFEYYGGKHLENILTAFVQLYWFPKKFNVDKRRSHLSSMIISGQMTRDDALAKMAEPLYDENTMQEYINIIKDKLGITDDEFDKIIADVSHEHEEYKTDKVSVWLRKIVH